MFMNSPKLNLFQWCEFSLIAIFFGLFSLGQLQRFELGSGQALYLQDLIASILILWWSRDMFKWLRPRLFKWSYAPWLLLVAWLGLGWGLSFMAGGNLRFAFLYLARLVFYIAFALGLALRPWWPKLKLTSETAIKGFLIITGSFIAYFGWLQYLFMPDLRFLGILGWDTHFYRLVSTQFDPTFTGLLLVLTILVIQHTQIAQKWLGRLLQVFLVVTIAFTYSRASYAALGISQLVTAWQMRRHKSLAGFSVGLIFLLLILLPILPRPGGEGVRLERINSGLARVSSSEEWLQSLTSLQWLTGRGLFVPLPSSATTSDDLVNHAQLPDNLEVLFTAGWGVGGWLILVAVIIKTKIWKHLTHLEWATASAIFIHAQFNNSLFEIFVWIFLWLILWSDKKSLKSQ